MRILFFIFTAIESDIHVRRGQADTLQYEIAQLDEDTKRAHKQFMHNRDNVEKFILLLYYSLISTF